MDLTSLRGPRRAIGILPPWPEGVVDQSDIGRRNPNVIPGGLPTDDLGPQPHAGRLRREPCGGHRLLRRRDDPHNDSGTTRIAADVAGWYSCCMTGWAPGRPNRSSQGKEVGGGILPAGDPPAR